MTRLYVFADESGDFTFTNAQNISRYFIVCTVSMESCEIGHDLLRLQRRLGWEDYPLGDCFHATKDRQQIRDAVFDLITKHPFQIQATIMEKCKAQPQTRKTNSMFYKYGWFYHFFHGMQNIIRPYTEVHVIAASIGIKKEREVFKHAISQVMKQTIQGKFCSADVLASCADPCLIVADYCAWAIQKKWEHSDSRSYDIIKDRITREFDLWEHGKVTYY